MTQETSKVGCHQDDLRSRGRCKELGVNEQGLTTRTGQLGPPTDQWTTLAAARTTSVIFLERPDGDAVVSVKHSGRSVPPGQRDVNGDAHRSQRRDGRSEGAAMTLIELLTKPEVITAAGTTSRTCRRGRYEPLRSWQDKPVIEPTGNIMAKYREQMRPLYDPTKTRRLWAKLGRNCDQKYRNDR